MFYVAILHTVNENIVGWSESEYLCQLFINHFLTPKNGIDVRKEHLQCINCETKRQILSYIQPHFEADVYYNNNVNIEKVLENHRIILIYDRDNNAIGITNVIYERSVIHVAIRYRIMKEIPSKLMKFTIIISILRAISYFDHQNLMDISYLKQIIFDAIRDESIDHMQYYIRTDDDMHYIGKL